MPSLDTYVNPPWLICCTETKEGFLLASLSDPASGGRSSFQQVVSAFLTAPGLPFANVLSAERIERVFTKYGDLFGNRHIYSTAVVVWGFLGQVLRDGKQASCQAAVACKSFLVMVVVTSCRRLMGM